MKKALIALAAAAAISPAAFAGDVSWGGDANVEGYLNRADEKGTDVQDQDLRGYTNRIRLKGTFKTDGNVSVNTRLILQDSEWAGDTHTGNTGPSRNSGGDAVGLDYGYIQAPIAGWTFRFGRQVANWANCFLTCDDRRDRILAMKRFGGTTVILLNDKRAGGSSVIAGITGVPTGALTGAVNTVWTDANSNSTVDAGEISYVPVAETVDIVADATVIGDETADSGEGDLYAAAAVGVVKGWQWGLLVGKWIGEESYVLDEVYAISPFVKGKAGPVKIEAAINVLGGGNEDGAALFTDVATSAYIKAGMDLNGIKLEGQIAVVQDGGLVAGGFDTFSMLINNNPENNQSSTNVDNLGGLGKVASDSETATKFGENAFADDELLIAVRASGSVNKFGWKASAVYFASKNNKEETATWLGGAVDLTEKDYSITTIEGGVTYKVAKTTELYLNAAIGKKSDDLDDSGDSDEDYQAATVGITTTF